jgi:hypothetical protein
MSLPKSVNLTVLEFDELPNDIKFNFLRTLELNFRVDREVFEQLEILVSMDVIVSVVLFST